uniref:Uncharacterized protein n=1 Tax=Octopus bimaculoides TaxID=37653 RepID=A0A0L8I4W5_OCTBM
MDLPKAFVAVTSQKNIGLSGKFLLIYTMLFSLAEITFRLNCFETMSILGRGYFQVEGKDGDALCNKRVHIWLVRNIMASIY